MHDKIDQSIEQNELQAAMRARFQVARLHGEKLAQEYRHKCAEALLGAGLTLIPSEHLQDHQFVVSRGVYEAAKELTS